MSSRDSDSYSGSSRSRSRDHDSRPHRDKYRADERQRSRSRERRDRYDKLSRNRSPVHQQRERTDEGQGQVRDMTPPPPPPPPPRISKITMGFSKPSSAPIKMSLGGSFSATGTAAGPVAGGKVPTSKNVAAVFNTSDDEDEPEEMPAEARMRMRNIGRETPTSAGPNSFGKTKQGFCDAKNVFEKSMKQAMDAAAGSGAKKQQAKFPQTIYKINNSL